MKSLACCFSWAAFGDNGNTYINKNFFLYVVFIIHDIQVDYYIEATEADNHAVREAACACIAEVGAKVTYLENLKILTTITITEKYTKKSFF